MPNAVASWSGGKDSAAALHKAVAAGVHVIGLFNIVSAETKRVAFQELPPNLVKVQAKALGLRLYQEVYVDTKNPESCRMQSSRIFSRLASQKGIRTLVSGHISETDVQKEQLVSLCREIGLILHAPLAGRTPESVLDDFFELNLKATIVKIDTSRVDKNWLGKPLNKKFVDYLRNKSLNPCGDLGEYHTLVTDGPLFKRALEFHAEGVIEEGPYISLDIRDWRLTGPRRTQ